MQANENDMLNELYFSFSSVILKTVVCYISFLRRCIMARNVAIGIQQYNELIEKIISILIKHLL